MPLVVARREKYFAATQRKFVPYSSPQIFRRGEGLVATMPAGHDWVVHLTSSGAEATDLALMMARSHTRNTDILSLRTSYHGATFGAQSVTGISSFRHPLPQVGGVSFVAEPNQYRGSFGAGVEPYLHEIDSAIHSSTSGSLAAMILEPVQGYGGIVPLPDGYISGAAQRVRAAGGLLIVDEVQSGVGRTGRAFWAFESHDVVPDIVIMAKGIGNGIPIGAVVARREIAESMAEKFPFHTYGANPIAAAAARAVLDTIARENLQENAVIVGRELKTALMALQEKYESIGDVRGEGLMLTIEFVKDRETKEPFPDMTARVFERTREHGLVASKSGPDRSVIRMCPPLRLSLSEVDAIADAFDKSLAGALVS